MTGETEKDDGSRQIGRSGVGTGAAIHHGSIRRSPNPPCTLPTAHCLGSPQFPGMPAIGG